MSDEECLVNLSSSFRHAEHSIAAAKTATIVLRKVYDRYLMDILRTVLPTFTI